LSYRAIVHACPTTRTQVCVDGSGALAYLDFEFAWLAVYGFKIRIGDKLDV
jgi:hypothetical protein